MATASRETIKEQLLASNTEFRHLASEHQKYEQRLSELTSLRYPSDEEQAEEMVLKRRKLHLKDQMEAIIHAYQDQNH